MFYHIMLYIIIITTIDIITITGGHSGGPVLAGDDSGERSGEDDGPRPAAGRVTDVVPLQDTPYGAVVYLPKRDSFARTKRTEEQM